MGDIVITTFESLSAELDTTVSKFVGSNLNRRYEILPSPIVGIRWNRIVFDEAQEVEGNAKSKIVQMAHKLHGNHKWFVSGTPLGTGNVTDLKNIMTLLNQTPFNEEIRWSHMVEGNNQINLRNSDFLPFNAYLFMMHLKSILSRVILRRSQFAVEAELNLPTQLKKTKFLTFSSIEKHHYDYIEQEIMKLIASSTVGAGVKLQEYEGAGSGDKVRTEFLSTTINNHLGTLRKLCLHPQMHGGRLTTRQAILSMTEICFKMIEDARKKCEETQRSLIFHSNALTGMCIIISQLAYKNDDVGLYHGYSAQSALKCAWDVMIDICIRYEIQRNVCPILATLQLTGNIRGSGGKERDDNTISSILVRSDDADFKWIIKPKVETSSLHANKDNQKYPI